MHLVGTPQESGKEARRRLGAQSGGGGVVGRDV